MTAAAFPTRPVLRYHGGKWRLAPWIISHFPAHRVYVEPFAGAASVLMRKPRVYAEVLNDLDGEVVNVFRVLRDPAQAARLQQLLALTPFAREEMATAYIHAEDPVERARRAIARAFMGFGSASFNAAHATGFRASAQRNGTTPAHDWRNYPRHIGAFAERLAGVCIENRPAVEVIAQQDSPTTLFYVDPPYPHGTRGSTRGVRQKYRHELADDEHRALAEVLRRVRGMVVLSGYPCALYDVELFSGWDRVERPCFADGGNARMEVLWLNPACSTALERERTPLGFTIPNRTESAPVPGNDEAPLGAGLRNTINDSDFRA